jgi:hypothetical protein
MEYRAKGVRHLAVRKSALVFLFLAVCAVSLVSVASAADKAAISPAFGLRDGKPFDVVVSTGTDDATCKAPASLVPLGGSGISVSNQKPEPPCTLAATLTIAPVSFPGVTSMQVQDSGKNPIGRVSFTIMDAVPGPIPPGIDPQVDVFWKVLGPKEVKDTFGGSVNRKYYAIEVAIGNNSGYELQLASVGFLMRDLAGNAVHFVEDEENQFLRTPSDDYHIVRSTTEKQQTVGVRSYVLNGLQAASLLGIGITPYFHNISHTSNYTTALNIAADPLQKGLSLVWPDLTIPELAKLDNLAMHDSQIVANNFQYRTVVFVARDTLKSRFPHEKQQTSGCLGNGSNAEPKCNTRRDDPMAVKYWLGNLIIVGNQIQYRQRIHINTSDNKAAVSALSITPAAFTVDDLTSTAGADVTLKGDSLAALQPAYPDLANGVLSLKLDDASSDGKSRTGKLTQVAGKTVSAASPLTIAIPYQGGTANLEIQIIHQCGPATAQALAQKDLAAAKISLNDLAAPEGCAADQLIGLAGQTATAGGYTFTFGSAGDCGAAGKCLKVAPPTSSPQAFDAAKDHLDFTLGNGQPARLKNVTITAP